MKDFRILLVDDEVDFVETLSERLSLGGYNVKAVSSPLEAMPLLHSFSPNLVLLDIKMPEMNGIEFLKLIKKINPSIDVIMLTAFGNMNFVEESMESGAIEYIIKPIDINELIIKIERVKKKHKNVEVSPAVFAIKPEIFDVQVEKTKQFLKETEIKFQKENMLVKLFIEEGEAYEKILELVDKIKAQMIILGTHGRTGLRRLLMGSTCQRAIGLSKLPVLVVK
jgi:DNA-binding NtrC family response regulator